MNCETDFVARTPDFQNLAHDIAMQIAGCLNPLVVSDDDELPADVEVARRRSWSCSSSRSSATRGKTIRDLVNETHRQDGREHPVIKRFARFELGT